MPTKIIMPKLGLTMTEGKLVRWLTREGEAVSKGQPVAEIETDKITTQIESPADGILGQIVVPEGKTVNVAEVIGWIVAPGEAPPTMAESAESEAVKESTQAPSRQAPRARTREKKPKATPNARRLAKELGIDLSQVTGTGPGGRITGDDVQNYARQREETGRIKASPIARKMAAEAGLDLRSIQGTGPGGRIVRADVEAALAARAKREPAPPSEPTPATTEIPPITTTAKVTPLAGVRAVIAERMSESHRTTARVTLTTEVDATELVRWREQLKDEAQKQGEPAVSYNDLLAKIAAVALREHPDVNARLVGEEIHQLAEINIGIAVDTDRGLLVPVVRNVDRKSLREISREARELIQRARTGASLPDDLTGGTFTITNLGMLEIDAFTPIINLPECAILGVGRIKEKPVVRDGEIVIRAMLWLSLTFDHRLVDGAPAARFLQRIKQLIEQPYRLIA